MKKIYITIKGLKKAPLSFTKRKMLEIVKSNSGTFQVGHLHPRWKTDEELLIRLRKIPLGCLSLTGNMRRMPKRRYCEAKCSECLKHSWLEVHNVFSGKTTNCKCRRRRKYPTDSRANTLGERYDAMIQRCNRWTHRHSHHYKGRGIKVEFNSREDFIMWALAEFPNSNFKGLQFDRIDNDGNYSKTNLRLVTPRENALNKKRLRTSPYYIPTTFRGQTVTIRMRDE